MSFRFSVGESSKYLKYRLDELGWNRIICGHDIRICQSQLLPRRCPYKQCGEESLEACADQLSDLRRYSA